MGSVSSVIGFEAYSSQLLLLDVKINIQEKWARLSYYIYHYVVTHYIFFITN